MVTEDEGKVNVKVEAMVKVKLKVMVMVKVHLVLGTELCALVTSLYFHGSLCAQIQSRHRTDQEHFKCQV